MSNPAWFDDLADDLGTRRRAGEISRQEAITALRDKIVEKDDQALILSVLGDFAGKAIDAWQREHQFPPVRGAVGILQMELFPDLRPRLTIRVGVSKPVMSLNAHDWDAARHMVLNRTKHSIEGAEADRRQFEAAYDLVRPHLTTADMTTADVAAAVRRGLRGEVPLEGLA